MPPLVLNLGLACCNKGSQNYMVAWKHITEATRKTRRQVLSLMFDRNPSSANTDHRACN